MVLVEGEGGDGATVDEDVFSVAADDEDATVTAAEQVVSAILGTREGAAEGGYQLASTGVTFSDPAEAVALRDALAAHKLENVMLVSAFLAAAALAQAVGNQTNYAQTALLFIEPDAATLAVVDSADGSIADVHRAALPDDDDAAVDRLAAMVSNAEALDPHPDAVFVVGSGIDLPLIKPALEASTALPLTVPEEPDTALARGAALASASAPLFASSTAALAYAQDPGTGAIDPVAAVAPGYLEASENAGDNNLAYSAVPDDFPDVFTGAQTAATSFLGAGAQHRSFRLLGTILAATFVLGVAALVVALAVAIRPNAGVRPSPGHNIVAPTRPMPAPAAPAPKPAAPAPKPAAPAPAPAAPAPAPAPVAPAPVAPAPAPAPVPAAPPPLPPPPPIAPVPIPLPIPGVGGPPVFGGPAPRGPFGGDDGGFPGIPHGGFHGGPGFGGPHFGLPGIPRL
ncbi:MAG: hypothetical protein PHQ28_11245 [Mycobacterium sp.]|nr:hypothetical protein [Mycobacterium sp.]